ncbi:hypothetical protein [Halolamina rubra]|uniref:hypothetical protein n=1 Tax=Halolamina rubra TaxID=1380430 RepID=UPI0006791167|nr:hypothetical protein [Halolamina rubra]
MSAFETVMTYVGGAVSIGGVAFAAAFLGYRTADPFAASIVGSLSLVSRVAGVAVGIVLAVAGFVVAVRLGDEERIAAALADEGE